ncbi:hypothetical protein E2C01_045549 [Portunus trituberculatus]|uniref:Uncharacterized protein n=1 Tax=Portunus trituberculatus TaxID=210409 RepID=A0A5B7G1H6_PORTR|nr:hypothetical protein [Portunus trituberculatus]
MFFFFFMSWPIVPVGNLKSIGSVVKLPHIMVPILGPMSPPKRIFGVNACKHLEPGYHGGM